MRVFKIAPFEKADKSIRFKKESTFNQGVRVFFLPLIVFVGMLILCIRLFQLTIVKGAYYRFAAENNRLRETTIEGKRGDVFDRRGIKIAYSDNKFRRIYPYSEATAHVLGYRQHATEVNLKDDACAIRLKLNDKVGVKGIEYLYECYLRPVKGKRLDEVDAKGKKLRTVSVLKPVQGKPLQLSIDADLQKKAYEIINENKITTGIEIDLSEKRSAVVAVKPNTGEVLLLMSYPSFKPEVFEDNSNKEKIAILKDEDKPLFNRALQGTYPPGSVFKTVVAAGALETHAIKADEVYVDEGFVKAGEAVFNNWYYTQYGKVEGPVDMVKALRRSTDTYFYKVAEKMTATKLRVWAEKFGFGKDTGIPLDAKPGIVPSDFWKREVIGEKWYLGDTYNMSIGQGYMLTTPLHIALATNVFASHGRLCKPQLLKIGSDINKAGLGGLFNERVIEQDCKDLGLAESTVETVRVGMKQACESGGTGWPFFSFSVKDGSGTSADTSVDSDTTATTSAGLQKGLRRIQVGCKTGTAESQSKDHAPHAWFTVFAPYDNPEITLTVLVENSGEGSNVAAPIAKELLKYYFER